MKVAIAQINPTVGDLQGNARRLESAARAAHAQGAVVVIAPELALCGYPPEDLLLRPAFMAACAQTLGQLAAALLHLDKRQPAVVEHDDRQREAQAPRGRHFAAGHPEAAITDQADHRARRVDELR